MSAQAAITRSWPVGKRTVTLSVPPLKHGTVMHAVIEWAPEQPPRLSGEEWHEYRVGRQIALAEIAGQLGIPMAVLDLL